MGTGVPIKCVHCGDPEHGHAPAVFDCVRSLAEQGQMQWNHVRALEEEVARLARGRSLEHEKGSQFVIHVDLDCVKVSWLDRGETASEIAGDLGRVVAERFGFKKRCTSSSPQGSFMEWRRA